MNPKKIDNQSFDSYLFPNHIASYRIYHFDDLAANSYVHFLPEGIIEIVFQLDLPISSRSRDHLSWQIRPQAFVGGLHNSAYHLKYDGTGRAFGIRFQAGGFANFIDNPVHLFKNRLLDLVELWGIKGRLWGEQILSAANISDQIRLSDSFFQEQYRQLSPFPCQHICEYIKQRKGQVQIQQLSNDFHLSPARFRQLFNERIGISPKAYCRIQRTKHALQNQPSDISLTDWAYTLGYFDQAHFTNDIKQITGLTPGECREVFFY